MRIDSPPFRRMAAGCVVVLAVAMLAGLAWYLADTQAIARDRILSDFSARGRLAADLTGDTLEASDAKTRGWATQSLAGPVPGLGEVLDANRDGIDSLVILSKDGVVLGASPRSAARAAASLPAGPGFRLAVATGKIAYGDVETAAGATTIHAFQPYAAADGTTRVLALPTAAGEIAAVVRSALDVTASHSYLIDSTGAVIVSFNNAKVGGPMPDRALAGAVRRSAHGVVDDSYYMTSPVSGSAWRVVIAVPRAVLMAPVIKPNRLAWMIFAGFAAMVVLMILIGTAALISSARVAHARLHDTLTGLPNRALFLAEAQSAIVQRRPIAVLYLDLDGFKPVNDSYGHAAGDAVLAEVGRRLVAATRPEDYVSRFGGDEFLVLCRGLDGEQDGHTVAERIQHYLTEPFDIDGRSVQLGVSIGIAMLEPHIRTADVLIHNADLALYAAKRNGRGRIERFTADLATAS